MLNRRRTQRLSRPSKRDVANLMEFYSGGTNIQAPLTSERKKPRKQAESAVNLTGKQWARTRNGVLYRNARGLAGFMPPKMPVGLGPNGTGDLVGFLTVTVTPEMVGRQVAVYAEFESKTQAGSLEDHQRERITWLKDRGAICGCCRSADDFEDAYQRWVRG